MKYLFYRLTLLAFILTVPRAASCQQPPKQFKVLIVYLSRTQNTQVLAHIIHQKVGGQIVALELEKPYPKDYKAQVQQVSEELEKGFLPPLKTKIDNIGQYDTVFIGFPTWAMSLPPPMQSFLHQNNFKGKVLIPFNTNAGYGLGSCLIKIKELCPQAHIKKEFSMVGGKEKDGIFLTIKDEKAKETEQKISAWLGSLKL